MSNRRTSARLLSVLDRNCLNVSNLSEEEAANLLNSSSRKNIAAGLVNYNFKRQAGRPSSRHPSSDSRPSTPDAIPGSFPVGRRAVHPVDDTRFDRMDHWPQWTEKRVTCKLCAQNKTKALTMCICSKCNIALCCFKAKNCFVEYHKKK